MTDQTPATRPYVHGTDQFIGTEPSIGYDFYETQMGQLRTMPHVPATPHEIGAYVPEKKGFYEGRWEPKDEDGVSYGKILDVFRSPKDLPDKHGKRLVTSFKKAVKATGNIKNFYGRNGAGFKSEEDLIKAVIEGDSEKLQKLWIPTGEILQNMVVHHTQSGGVEHGFSQNDEYWSCSFSSGEKKLIYVDNFHGNILSNIHGHYHGHTPSNMGQKKATRPIWAELVAEF